MNNRNAIALFATQSHIDKVKAVISSCFHFGQWKGDFIVFLDECSDSDRRQFQDKGVIVVAFDPNRFCNIFNPEQVDKRWHVSVMYRFLMFYFQCFRLWDKILYLDTDVLCCKKIVLPEFDVFGAHGEVTLTHKNRIFDHPKRPHALSTQIHYRYKGSNIFDHLSPVLNSTTFNSGIFAFRPQRFGKQMKRDFLNITQNYLKYFSMPDQGVLNLMFVNEWFEMGEEFGDGKLRLESEWKFEETGGENKDIIRFQMLVHTFGTLKKVFSENSPFFPDWEAALNKFQEVSISVDKDNIEKFKNLLEKDFAQYSDENILNTLNTSIKKIDLTEEYSKKLLS